MKKHLLILLAFPLLLSTVFSQEYNFENYTVDNGLPVTQILDIDQLPDGRMVIGTQNGGFSIYDGNKFTTFNDELGLVNNIVYDVVPYKGGRIACATNNGLSIFKNGQFKNYTTDNGLSHNRIYKLLEEPDWILLGTAQGVCRYANGEAHKISIHPGLDSSIVFNIKKLKDGSYLYCSGGAGAYIVGTDGQVEHLDLLDSYDFVFDAIEMGDSALWLLGFDGINSYENGKLRKVENIPDGRSYNCGMVDHNGTIWIGTDVSLLRIDKDGIQEITTFNGLVNNQIWKIFEDREGNVWFVSRQNGISKLSNQAFRHYLHYEGVENQPYLGSGAVQSVFIDSKDRIWIGQESGYSIVNSYAFTPVAVNILGHNGITQFNIEHFGFLELDDGAILAGTDRGLNFPEQPISKRIDANSIAEGPEELGFVYCAFKAKDGKIWLGTRGGPATLEGRVITGALNVVGTDKDVYAIHQTANGNLLFATDGGLVEYDGESSVKYRRLEGLVDDRVRSIVQGENGTIWLATNEGIFRKKGTEFKAFTIKNKLSSNAIYSLQFDDEGYLWAGLSKGIDKIRIKEDEIISVDHFSTSEGFIGKQCMMNAIATDRLGHLWIGTVAGVTEFIPNLYEKNMTVPQTLLNSVNLFGQATDWNLFADSVGSDNIPVSLELPYHQNYLSFNYIGVSMVASDQVRYRYMLEGLDKDWTATTSLNEASYTGLEPGVYTFKVISANNEGIWNDEPVTFSFVITPPFWNTWWFYCICGIVLLTGVYSYLKIRAANKKILLANDKITTQASIIEEKNKDITDSIEYAKRLQEAFLPSPIEIKNSFADAFVLFKPKDIVSGDFFWFENKGPMRIIVAADCTGHGVPGAMMSMVGNNLLNQIINDREVASPAKALDEMDIKLQQALQNAEGGAQDGMDIAMCAFNMDTKLLDYSGANNPLYIIRSSGNPVIINGEELEPRIVDGDLKFFEVKATRQPIGAYSDKIPFELNQIQTEEGDSFYIFSDGYADQFGGPRGKKFRYKQFRELLLEFYKESMPDQKTALDNKLSLWQGGMEQVDDICIIGLKV